MKIKKSEVVKFLEEGGLVIFPTDTVYGFLALLENKKATNKIYKIKNRPKSKPLAVFVKDFKMAKGLAKISPEQEKILKKKWPGKYTFILNAAGGKKTIALRIPKYKPLNNLLRKINKPLAQTSVNISGQPELNKIKDIREKFEKCGVLIFDDGNLPKRMPSAIIDLTKHEITKIR
ncbi:MAG TPA: L-threonylcarbamoyladenylate synthase [Candidatus Staskawiczbacteria bacterium]|nr:L-threonylcarbamoyladenylate synthase [Candidatus Staskawiczbacteria bacterium]